VLVNDEFSELKEFDMALTITLAQVSHNIVLLYLM